MEIHTVTEALGQNALAAVFVNVLLQQLGLPIPAVPTLLVAGSLLVAPAAALPLLAAAVLSSVLADWVWYRLGVRYGYRVLAGLCRLSINPASCVSQTETRFVRWGLWSLVVAKFVPGFSTVAPPIAGAMRMSLPGFLAAASLGALLWSGSALLAGWLFRGELQTLIGMLERNGASVAVVGGGLLALWLAWKSWQKIRFERFAAIPHISPAELEEAMAAAEKPLVLDLRGPTMVAETGLIPGAVAADHDALLDAVRGWPKTAAIVTLCACPQDAGAIDAARKLTAAGWLSVRPLRGGYDALPMRLKKGESVVVAADS